MTLNFDPLINAIFSNFAYVLKILLMKYTKSFNLFWRAVKSTRHEMWVSLQVLIVVTLILSLALFLVEHNAQPDVFTNYWDAFLWSTMGYIDDPGEFATYTPITFWGRVLKIACALVNIAIFAVPAGLIAGGFSDAIAEDKREQELRDLQARLSKAFRRRQAKKTNIRTVPRYISITDITVNQEIDTKDIIDAVRADNNLRICNLASATPENQNPIDRIVIEKIPETGITSYGININRKSNVTIIAPSASSEVGFSNFAYYLALFGGFNYISKEYDVDKDEPQSFYIIKNPEATEPLKEYINDVKKLSEGKKSWAIFLIAADSVHPEHLHFITKAKETVNNSYSTIIEQEKFNEMFAFVSSRMKQEFGLTSEMDNRYRAIGENNISSRIGGGKETNAFTLRLDWSITAFNINYMHIAMELAKIFSESLADKQIEYTKKWEEPGFDYNYES